MISNCLLIQTGTLEAHLTGDWGVSICGHDGLTISFEKICDGRVVF